jgi:hypothetical protein
MGFPEASRQIHQEKAIRLFIFAIILNDFVHKRVLCIPIIIIEYHGHDLAKKTELYKKTI